MSSPAVDEKLKVAMLAPISWRVPPRHYGPWELFVSLLTEGLIDRGVDVTLFATADSQTRARLVGSAPTGYSDPPPVLLFVAMRTTLPAAQRFPSPKTEPLPLDCCAVPWKYSTELLGIPVPMSLKLS